MATFSKSKTLLTSAAVVSVSASSVNITSTIDVSAKMGAAVYVKFGRRSATSAGAGANLRVECSFDSSGNNTWHTVTTIISNFGTANSVAVNGTCSSGQAVVPMTSTTGMVVGGIVYIDNGTIANSEWGRIKIVTTNTSITLEDNLVNAQTGATVYTLAEIYSPVQLPDGAMRARVVADGSLFTQAFAYAVNIVTVDGIA